MMWQNLRNLGKWLIAPNVQSLGNSLFYPLFSGKRNVVWSWMNYHVYLCKRTPYRVPNRGPESIHVTWHTKCLTNRVLGKVMRDLCPCPDTLFYASFMCTLQSAIKHGSTVSLIFVSYSSEFVEHEEAVIRTYCLLVRNMGHKLKVWVTYRIDLINCKN